MKNLSRFVKNIWKFRRALWHWNWWDNAFIYYFLHDMFVDMEKGYRSENSHCLNAQKKAEKIKICRILCRRLIDSEYIGMYYSFGEGCWSLERKKTVLGPDIHRSDTQEQRDREYLFTQINKHIDGWWD